MDASPFFGAVLLGVPLFAAVGLLVWGGVGTHPRWRRILVLALAAAIVLTYLAFGISAYFAAEFA